jgi:hypothetical protein
MRINRHFSTKVVHKVVEKSQVFFSNTLKDKKFAEFALVLCDSAALAERREL